MILEFTKQHFVIMQLEAMQWRAGLILRAVVPLQQCVLISARRAFWTKQAFLLLPDLL